MQKKRVFQSEVGEDFLKDDLEKYKSLAEDLGSMDTKIISTDMIVMDERVHARCVSPMCQYYGTNLNCPPHSWVLNETRKIVSRYKYGILTMMQVPPEEQAGPDYNDSEKHKVPDALKMYKIVSKIQSASYYDGYCFSIAFGGGPSCKRVFCPKLECNGIQGKGCRFALKVNPTLHGVGMDVVAIASKAGWSMYPIGKETKPCEIPYGIELGLVLIH
jgi:predicted metal-binding protein